MTRPKRTGRSITRRTAAALAASVCALAAGRCMKKAEPTVAAATSAVERPAQATQPARPLRVLFVGNSYTYCNELPLMLEQFGRAGGQTIETAQSVRGGWTLRQHWDGGHARKAIAAGKWDYVVLQEQSQRPIVRPEAMHKYVRLFDEEIRKAGGRTVLFETWARKDEPGRQAALTKAYADIAGELGAAVAPVGGAWQKALAQRADLDFYHADNSHPTPAGSYLAACVFYAVLTGRNPQHLPAQITVELQAGAGKVKRVAATLSDRDAAFLQRIAWGAVTGPRTPATQPAAKPRE